MAHNYQEKPQPSTQQYYDQPPTQYNPSAPAEYPVPPPQYSVLDPSLQPHTPAQQQPVAIHQQQLQHVVVLQIPFDRHPINTTCPSCRSNIVTKVKTEPNILTHILAGIFCFLCWLPCVCLPYCMTSCQSSVHYCPNCAAYLGAYQPHRGGQSYRGGRRY